MKYRVWHNCQIGVVKNFYVDVKNEEEAWLVLNTLWDYDYFQYLKRIKGIMQIQVVFNILMKKKTIGVNGMMKTIYPLENILKI